MYLCPEVQDPRNTAGLSSKSAPCTIHVLTPQITIKLWGRSRGKKTSKNQAVDKLQQSRPKVVYQYSAYLNFWVFSYLQFPPPHHAFLLVTCFLFLAFDFGNTEVSVSPRTGWGIPEPLYAGCVCVHLVPPRDPAPGALDGGSYSTSVPPALPWPWPHITYRIQVLSWPQVFLITWKECLKQQSVFGNWSPEEHIQQLLSYIPLSQALEKNCPPPNSRCLCSPTKVAAGEHGHMNNTWGTQSIFTFFFFP